MVSFSFSLMMLVSASDLNPFVPLNCPFYLSMLLLMDVELNGSYLERAGWLTGFWFLRMSRLKEIYLLLWCFHNILETVEEIWYNLFAFSPFWEVGISFRSLLNVYSPRGLSFSDTFRQLFPSSPWNTIFSLLSGFSPSFLSSSGGVLHL